VRSPQSRVCKSLCENLMPRFVGARHAAGFSKLAFSIAVNATEDLNPEVDARFESRGAAQEFSPGWSRKAEPWVSVLNEDKP